MATKRKRNNSETEFGAFLRQQREGRGLTYREAASLTGLTHTRLFDLEHGVSSKTQRPVRPSKANLEALSRAYGVDYAVLLTLAMLPSSGEPVGGLTPDDLQAVTLMRQLSPEKQQLWLRIGEGLRDLADP